MKYSVLVYKDFNGTYKRFMGQGSVYRVKNLLLDYKDARSVGIAEIRVVANNVDFSVGYGLMFNEPIITTGRLIYKKSVQFGGVLNV